MLLSEVGEGRIMQDYSSTEMTLLSETNPGRTDDCKW